MAARASADNNIIAEMDWQEENKQSVLGFFANTSSTSLAKPWYCKLPQDDENSTASEKYDALPPHITMHRNGKHDVKVKVTVGGEKKRKADPFDLVASVRATEKKKKKKKKSRGK